ncbi:MAG: adenylyl-sulfate kinase [Planctomycetota bacterium]|nr:MAG: adenylyl-sulfate kinase [Planctomycetota bacterium]
MSNVIWHEHRVTPADRARLMGHAGAVVWFTGLSGSGKSTVANLVEERLHRRGIHTFLLDGDNVRMGLNPSADELRGVYGDEFARRFGLGFSADDRAENIRRIAAVAQLFAAAGIVTLTAFVSPYRRDRDAVRTRLGGDFVEVFVDAPLAVCEQRDPKGLYKKARAGEIKNFTGIDDPYEPPLAPEIHLQADANVPETLADQVVAYLQMTGRIP